jgi:hypothetical protein
MHHYEEEYPEVKGPKVVKPSVRVHQAPGGASSFSIGGDESAGWTDKPVYQAAPS